MSVNYVQNLLNQLLILFIYIYSHHTRTCPACCKFLPWMNYWEQNDRTIKLCSFTCQVNVAAVSNVINSKSQTIGRQYLKAYIFHATIMYFWDSKMLKSQKKSNKRNYIDCTLVFICLIIPAVANIACNMHIFLLGF